MSPLTVRLSHQSSSSTPVDPELREPGLEPERDEEAGPVGRPEAPDRLGVQVVVVVVRDDDEVDRRQVLEPDAGRHDPARPGERQRARPLRPLGIGQEAHPVQLDQHGRVPHPGHGRRPGVLAERASVVRGDRELLAGREGRLQEARDDELPPRPEVGARVLGVQIAEPALEVMRRSAGLRRAGALAPGREDRDEAQEGRERERHAASIRERCGGSRFARGRAEEFRDPRARPTGARAEGRRPRLRVAPSRRGGG